MSKQPKTAHLALAIKCKFHHYSKHFVISISQGVKSLKIIQAAYSRYFYEAQGFAAIFFGVKKYQNMTVSITRSLISFFLPILSP